MSSNEVGYNMSVDLTDQPGASTARSADPVERGRSRKQGQARRDELRRTVLEAVERRLRSGTRYNDLNVADVSKDAGISRATFYSYFIDKPTLLRTWYAEFHRELQVSAREWWSLDGSATRTDLKRALGGIMAATRAHPELLAATHDAIGSDERVREAVHGVMTVYIDETQAHIEAGQKAGFVDPSLPPAETAYWLQWMAERALHMLGRRSRDDLDRMLQAHTAILWNTLYAPTRGSRTGAVS